MEKNHKLLNFRNLSDKNSSKKALLSAFFCAPLLFCTLSIIASPSAISLPLGNCDTQQFDETATLKYVHDGDTIRLSDNRKIRLLGIDTPELAHKGRPTQPFALDAKKSLKTLLSKNNGVVNLVYGKEKKDHYGRTLAHLFLDSGLNVQTALISQGLAIAFATPPNVRLTDCYSSVEAETRLTNQGIWGTPKYRTLPADMVTNSTKGFHIIESKVNDVRIRPKSAWINLQNNINIKIQAKDLQYFDSKSLMRLKGSTIQIRGWLHPKEKGFFMSLRHPSALRITERQSVN